MRAGAIALAVVCVSGSALANQPCPDAAPRLFPPSGTFIPRDVELFFFLRPEQKKALDAFDKVAISLEASGLSVPLKRDPAQRTLQSAVGEEAFAYRPVTKLRPGKIYHLKGLPKLPPEWSSLSQAIWTVESRPNTSVKQPVVAAKKLGRTYCAAPGPDARVCGLALAGHNDTQLPVLMEVSLEGNDQHAASSIFADVIQPSGELALHNRMCDAKMAELKGGEYDASFYLVDFAGRRSEPWKSRISIQDVNEEMSKLGNPKR